MAALMPDSINLTTTDTTFLTRDGGTFWREMTQHFD